MMDFDLQRDVGLVWRVNRDIQSSPAQAGVVSLRTWLRQEQAGRPGRRTAVGDSGKASNLLQQR
jgi:hypothetical protein